MPLNSSNFAISEHQILRLGPLVAFQGPANQALGFNSNSLEVARLTDEVVTEMLNPGQNPEVADLLREWKQSPRAEAQDLSQFQSMNINVTQICNLHCTYCAAGGDGTYGDPVARISVDKTIPQIRMLMNRLPPAGSFKITFLGGEPLLYPAGIELLAKAAAEIAKEKQIELSLKVVTNGSLLTIENVELLNRIQCQIYVSWDGPEQIQNKVRPSRGPEKSFDQVRRGLDVLFKNRSEIPWIGFSAVFGSFNTNVLETYKIFSEYAVDEMAFDYDHSLNDPESSHAYLSQITEVAALAYSKGGEKELRKISIFDAYFKTLDSKRRVDNFCGQGKNLWVVDSRNKIYGCPWVVGDSKEIMGLGEQIWEDSLVAYQAPLNEKPDCQTCWAKNLCGGGCMFIHKQATGSKFKVDKVFCERIRYLIHLSIVYYERSREETL